MFRTVIGSLLVALQGLQPGATILPSEIETVSFVNSRASRQSSSDGVGDDQCETGQFDYFIYTGAEGNGVNWDDARAFCRDPTGFDGDLTSIHCQAEIDFIRDNLAKPFGGVFQSYWVGGKRKSRGGSLTWPSLVVDRSWYVINTLA
jgi:hypothetical protein